MDLKFYLIDTWSYLQKHCKHMWDLPQKSLRIEIERSGCHGLIIPRAPTGALFSSTCLGRGKTGYLHHYGHSFRDSVGKQNQSRSLWSGSTFHQKLHLINENIRKVMCSEKNRVFRCSFVIRQICLLNEPLLQFSFPARVCKAQSFLSDNLLQAIGVIEVLILWLIPSICLVLITSKLALLCQLL